MDKDTEIVKLMFTFKLPIDDVELGDDHIKLFVNGINIGQVPIISRPFGELKYESAERSKDRIDWGRICSLFDGTIRRLIMKDLGASEVVITPLSLWYVAVKNVNDGSLSRYECVFNNDEWHVKSMQDELIKKEIR